MGRLSPFSSSIILGIALFILTVLTPNHAAPVQDSAISPQVDGKGCYFMNKHYLSGHEIETNEPCLNCTCVESTLMCYLRVCPFIKPVGENCVSEMHVGDCCPKYWCPEVYPRITTEAPETEAKGCYLDGRYYMEGDRLPMNPVKPCEACYCIRNTSVCTMQTCELSIDGCFPQYKAGSCCPARYNCTDDAATTIPPGVMDAEQYEGCLHNGKMYKDGEQVPSEVKCNQCYCMKHSVVCAVASCKAPAENCVPHETPDGQCCPEKYDCPEGTEIPDSATTHMITTEEEYLHLTTLYKTPSTLTTASVSASAADEDLTSGVDAETFSTTEQESLYPTTKGIRRIDDADLVSTLSTIDEMVSTEDELVKTTTKSTTAAPRVTTRGPFFPSKPIPGEGVCRHHNKTYQNGEQFESDDPCLKNCTCVNSVVKCNTMECVLQPPKAGINCKVKRIPEECCPVFVCDVPLSPPSPDEVEEGQQQEIFDTLTTTPKTEQQEIIPESESATLETEVQKEVTSTHDMDQETAVDAIVTTVGTKELDKTTVSDSSESTSITEVSITDMPSISTETDDLPMETITTSDEIITDTDRSQETVSDKTTITKLETTLAAETVTPLITISTSEGLETTTHPESTETDVPITETIIAGEEVFTETDSQKTVSEDTATKLNTTLAAETVTPITTLSSTTGIPITSTRSTPTQTEVSPKETTVVRDETSTKIEQPETDETKFEESLTAETSTALTTEETVTDKTITTTADDKTKTTLEDEIATTPFKPADKDIPITDEELKSEFTTTAEQDSITKETLSTKTIPDEISTEIADSSRTTSTTTVMPEADKDTDVPKMSETTTVSLGDTSDEVSRTTVSTGLESTTIFKQETTSDIIQTAVTKEEETDSTLLQTEEAYSTSTEGELKLDQSTVIEEGSTTKQPALPSTMSEEISTEQTDIKPTVASTTVEEKKDIDVSKEGEITTSAEKFDKVSSTTEATEFDLTSTIIKETTTVIQHTTVKEEKETSATHIQTEEAITSTEEESKLDLSTVVDDASTAKSTTLRPTELLPGDISTEKPDTAKPTTITVEEKDTSVTKQTEITTPMSDKLDVVSSTTEAIVPESTGLESETSTDTLQTEVTEETVSDKLITPEKEDTTLSEITTSEKIKTTSELEAGTTEKTVITSEPQTSTELKEDITSVVTTKILSDVTSGILISNDTETVTQEVPVTQEADKVTSTSEIVPVKESETETFPTEDVKKETLEPEIITTEIPQKVTSKPEDLLKDITSTTSYSEILTTDGIELTTKFEQPVTEEFKTTLKPITIKTEEAETISSITEEEVTTGSETSVTEEKRIATKDEDFSPSEVTTTPRISEPTVAFRATTSSEPLESETKPSDTTTESEDKTDSSETSFDHEVSEKPISEVDTTETGVISVKPTLSTGKTETEATEVTKFTSLETTGTMKLTTVIPDVTKLSITTLKSETEKDESTTILETDITEATTFKDQTTSISKTSPVDTTPEQTESEMVFETSEVTDHTGDTLKKSTFDQEFTDKFTTKFEWSSPVFTTVTSTSVSSHPTEELFEITDIGTTLFDGEEKDKDTVKTTESKDVTEITPSDITSSKPSTEHTTQSHDFVTKDKDVPTTETQEEKITLISTEEISKDLTELKTTLSVFETTKDETVTEITSPKTDKTDLPMDTKAVEISTPVTESPDLVTTISIKTEVTGSTQSAAPEIEETKKADVSTESAVPYSTIKPTGETDITTVITGLTSEKPSSQDQADLVTLTESMTEETTAIGTKQETSDLDKFETDSLEGVTEAVSKQDQETTTKLEGDDIKTTSSATVSETPKVITTVTEVFSTHSTTEERTTLSKLETITPDSEISLLPTTSTPKSEDLDSEISSTTVITKIPETSDAITDTLSPVLGAETTTSKTSSITDYHEMESTMKSDTEKTEIIPTEKSTKVSSEIVTTVSETGTTFPTSVDNKTFVPSDATTEKPESDFTTSTEGIRFSDATEITDKTTPESDEEPETVLTTTEKVKPEDDKIASTGVEEEETVLTTTVTKVPFTTASHPSTEIPSSTLKITDKSITTSFTTFGPSEETVDTMTTIKISDVSVTETEDLESKTTIKFDTEKLSTVPKDITVESQTSKDGLVTATLSTPKELEGKDITTPTSYDISETSDHTPSTLETEIVTDNVFTPIKHQPDSLIREKSTTPEIKIDTITSSPMSEITETVTLTDTSKISPDITQEAETVSTMEFSKTESGLEESTTQEIQHEAVTEKTSSETPSKVELTEPSDADKIIKDKTISVPDITTVTTIDDREIKTTGTVSSDVQTTATVSSTSFSEAQTSTTEGSIESASTIEKTDRTTISVELGTGTQETERDEGLTVTDISIQKETLPVSKEISTETPSKAIDITSSTEKLVTSTTEESITETISKEDGTESKITEETTESTLTTKTFSAEDTGKDKFTTEALSQETSTEDSDLMTSKQTEEIPLAAVTDAKTETPTTYKYDEVSTESPSIDTSVETDKKVEETTSDSDLKTLSTITTHESYETESELLVTKSEVSSDSEETDLTIDRDSFEITSVSDEETKTPVRITTTDVLAGQTTTTPSLKTETIEVSTFTSEKIDVTDTSKIETTTDKITTISSITEDQEKISSTKDITTESSVVSETEPTVQRETLPKTTGSEIFTPESSPPSYGTENTTFDEELESTKIGTQTPESLFVTKLVTLPDIVHSTITSSDIEEITTSIPLFEKRKTTLPPVDFPVSTSETLNDTLEADIVTTSIPSDFTISLTSDLDEKLEISTLTDLERNLTESTIIVSTTDLHDLTTKDTTKGEITMAGEETTTAASKTPTTRIEGADDAEKASSTPTQDDAKSTTTFEAELVSSIKPFVTEVEDHFTTVTDIEKKTTETTPRSDTISDHLPFETTLQTESPTQESITSSPTDVKLTTIHDKEINISESVSPEVTEPPITSDISKEESTTPEKDITQTSSLETETVTMESEVSSTKEEATTKGMPIITSSIPELETETVSTDKTEVTEAELIDKISLTTDEEASTHVFETEKTSEKIDMKTTRTAVSSETEVTEKMYTSILTTTEEPKESEKISTQSIEITTLEPKVITDFDKELTSVAPVSVKESTTVSEEFDDSKITKLTTQQQSTTLLSSSLVPTDVDKFVTERAETEEETVVSGESSTLSTAKEPLSVTSDISLKEPTTTERVTVDLEEKVVTETSVFTDTPEVTTVRKSTEKEEETSKFDETTEMRLESSTAFVPVKIDTIPEISSTVQSTEETESEKDISVTKDTPSSESTVQFDKTTELPEILTPGTSETPHKTEILLTDTTPQDIAKIKTVAAKEEAISTTQTDFKFSTTTLTEKELDETEEPKVSTGTEVSDSSTTKKTDLTRDSLGTTVTEITLKDSSPEVTELSTKPDIVPETVDLKTLADKTETSTALPEFEEKISTLESATEIQKTTDIKKSTTLTEDETSTPSSIALDLSSEKEISLTTDKTEDSTEFMTKSDVESTEVKTSTDEFIKTSMATSTTPPEKDITGITLSKTDKTTDESEREVITTASTAPDLELTKFTTVDKTETTFRDDDKTKSTPPPTTTEFLETITDEYGILNETSDMDKENVTVTISEAEEITEKDFSSTTSKIIDMVTKDELDQSTFTTLKDLTSSEETSRIATLKSFETTEKKFIDLTDKITGTESSIFTTKTTEFVPNITESMRETEAETDVSYAIAHSLPTMKPAEKTEVTMDVSDADTTSVTLKVKTTEPSDITETKEAEETTLKVSTQTSVIKPKDEEEKTALPTETESPVDDGTHTEILPSLQTTKKTQLPEEISTAASTSSEKPMTSTPHFITEETTTEREISTVKEEITTEHTVVTEETELKSATFEADSMIITRSTTEPPITSFLGNDTEEELFTRDESIESLPKSTTIITKTDIPKDLVSDVTSTSKTTPSEKSDAETESLQTSPVSEKTTTHSEFSSSPSEMTVDTETQKISSLEPELKATTMKSTDASDIYSDSELPEEYFSRRDEKIDTVTTEVSEISSESDILTSTVLDDLKTTLKTTEIIEDISTPKLIKTETKATESIEVDEFTAKDTEMTPEVTKAVTSKITTEPVTDSIVETDTTRDLKATTLGAPEEATLFERKGTILPITSSSQATFDVTEDAFTQTGETVDEQDITSPEIQKEVTMIEKEETDEQKTSTFALSTKEYPVETKSPPSRTPIVSPEVITDETTSEKSISTDLEREDFTSETKALSEVETSTEMKFDILSTTLSPDDTKTEMDSTFDMKDDCIINGTSYKDGEAIITIEPCEKCHCTLGEIRCFKILCKLPKEGCKPSISSTSECCPSSYECPEEDVSVPSTTTVRSVSDKDLTTPIPISFMFSTTPKSIASTMLITKSDDLTESTEERDSKEQETVSIKDITSTLTDVSPKVTEETALEEEVTHLPTLYSTPEASDLFPSSTGSSAETVTVGVISKQDNQTTDKDVGSTEAIEQEMSTTLRDDLTRETVTVTPTSAGEVTTSTGMPTSRIYPTSTEGKEKISEVTKQTTETPTTFDTIKTTFEVTQEEKEAETTSVPDSTTTPYSTTMQSNLTTAFETVSSTGIAFEDRLTEKAETMLPVTVKEDKTTEKAITEQDKITTQISGETTTVQVELSSDKEGTMTSADFTKEIILEKMSTTMTPEMFTTEETKPTEITIKENLTTTPTAMPSKLPKLDDMLTSTIEIRSETLSTIFTEDTEIKEVTKTDITERKTTIEEITVPSFETTDSRATFKDSDVTTESKLAVAEDALSTKASVDQDVTTATLSSEDASTTERVNKTTEELLSTLFGSPTEKPTSVGTFTVTKSELLSETTDSFKTSSLFETKQDTLPTEAIVTHEEVLGLTEEEEFDIDNKYLTEIDKFNITSSTLPTSSFIPEETTEFEIITEISLMNKTIPSLDKEGTTEKEILTPPVSIPVTHMDETITNKTTDFEEEVEKVGTVSTLSDFSDKIFTFVSTRFTELMTGTEEFTTLTPQTEIVDVSKKQTTVMTTSDLSTEKVDKSVTPFIPLTRRIDLETDRPTLESSTRQEAETTQSPFIERTTIKELVTKSEDESTFDIVGNATIDESTFKSTETPEDILTTISSIITSLKQDTVTPSSLAEKPVTSTMQDALSEITKETSSTEDEDKFRTTEKLRIDVTTIPGSATSTKKDSDASSTSITEEFKMETLQTVSTVLESDISTRKPETQPISTSTESEEGVSDYTKMPSRATRKDIRFETTPISFTGTEEQETKTTDKEKSTIRVGDDRSTTKEVISTTIISTLSSTFESSTPSPITKITDKFDLPTLSTLFSILTNESIEETDLERNETSSTPFAEKPVDVLKTTTPDEGKTTILEVTSEKEVDESSRDIEAKLTTTIQDAETASPTATREEISTLGEATKTTEKDTFTERPTLLYSATKVDDKLTSPEEVSVTEKEDNITEISKTTVVTQKIAEQTTSSSDAGESTTISLSPKIETTTFDGDQLTEKAETLTEKALTSESPKVTEKETGKTEGVEQMKTTVSVGENITAPSEVTVKVEAETLSLVVSTTEIPKTTEAETRTESTEPELTPTISEKTTQVTELDKDVATSESDTEPDAQTTQTVRSEVTKTSDIPMTTEIRDRTVSTESPISTNKTDETTEPTIVTRKTETTTETIVAESETSEMTEKETFTTGKEKITGEPTSAPVTMKAETVSDEISTPAEILRKTIKEVTTQGEEQPKLTTKMDEKSTTTVEEEKARTIAEDEATITAEAEAISSVTYDKESSTESQTPESSPEVSSPVSREEANTTTDLTKGPKAIDTTPASYVTTPYSTAADIETTTIQEEEDYLVDENTCIFEGRIYQSAEQIPRPDPCEFCFCFRGDIICLQQSCPPPLPNCQQTSIPGYCCPRYECPVYLASKNITQFSRRKGVNPIIIQKRIDKREIARPVVEVKGCQINGTFYEMGKTVTSASGPCLHCVCQEDGFLHCDPQRCKPQPPLMLKMNSNYFRR